MCIKIVRQPPYSTDLALCDSCLFSKLRGYRYETIEEVKEAVTKVIACSHKRTSMGHSRSCWNGTSVLHPEDIISKGTRVSSVYYQYKCPYEKSLETYLIILVSEFVHQSRCYIHFRTNTFGKGTNPFLN